MYPFNIVLTCGTGILGFSVKGIKWGHYEILVILNGGCVVRDIAAGPVVVSPRAPAGIPGSVGGFRGWGGGCGGYLCVHVCLTARPAHWAPVKALAWTLDGGEGSCLLLLNRNKHSDRTLPWRTPRA